MIEAWAVPSGVLDFGLINSLQCSYHFLDKCYYLELFMRFGRYLLDLIGIDLDPQDELVQDLKPEAPLISWETLLNLLVVVENVGYRSTS